MIRNRFTIAGALALALASALPFMQAAHASASLQTAHAYLCAPAPAVGTPGPRRVVNTSSTASPQPSYSLNAQGCAVIAAADIGFFQSQGYVNGPNTFTLQQTAITASTTASTSTITLPAYAVVHAIVLSETAGHSITGGVDVGDASSATTFASAIALGANANIAAIDSFTNASSSTAYLTHVPVATGVPTADQILVACHSACNSGSINITIVYGYDW